MPMLRTSLISLALVITVARGQTPATNSNVRESAPKNSAQQAQTGAAQPETFHCDTQKPNSTELQLEGSDEPIPISINSSGNGTVTFFLKNTKGEQLTLSPADFNVTDFCHQPINAGDSEYLLGSQATLTGVPNAPVARDADSPLKLVVAQVWETGLSIAQLKKGPTTVCLFKAMKDPMPFAVQIDGSSPEALFAPGEVPTVVLSNADHSSYGFKWSLVLPNRNPTEEKYGKIAPNGKLTLDLSAAKIQPSWFSAGTLRDEVLNGTLQLQPQATPGMAPQPAKQLPLKVRLRYWKGYWQQFWNILLTGILIFVGMFLSLAYRYVIPSAATGIKIRRQIAEMKRKLSGIDENLPTQPRTVLEATIESCKQNLRAVPLFSPAAAALQSEVQASVSMCSAWIDCAYSVAEILAEARVALQTGLAPTLMRMIVDKCVAAVHPLLSGFTKPEELQAMNDAVKDARKYQDAANNDEPIPDLEAALKKRLDLLKPETLATLRKDYPGYANLFEQAEKLSTSISPATYRDVDIITSKVKLLARYRDLAFRVGATTFPPPSVDEPKNALERMGKNSERYLAYVNPESYESLNMARVLLAEMEQDFYPKSLKDELAKNPPGACIEAVPSPVEPGVPVHYSLRFVRTALNHVAAVQEWSLVWKFTEDTAARDNAIKSRSLLSRFRTGFRQPSQQSKPLDSSGQTKAETVAQAPDAEAGWDVYHRFKGQGEHKVAVDLFDIDGNEIPTSVPLSRPIVMKTETSAKRRWYKFWTWTGEARIEFLKMSFVFLIAICGVFATARDKVEQVGIFEGAAALVAIGFAADVIKSAISSNPGEK